MAYSMLVRLKPHQKIYTRFSSSERNDGERIKQYNIKVSGCCFVVCFLCGFFLSTWTHSLRPGLLVRVGDTHLDHAVNYFVVLHNLCENVGVVFVQWISPPFASSPGHESILYI